MASSSALSYMRRKTARYVRNVGRSVGYVAIEEIKPHSSAITQLYKDSKELSNNLKKSANARHMQKLKNRAATTTLSASANRQKKEGSTFTKNLLSDLKSGKWYNQERMDKASQDLFDMGVDADNYTGVSFDFGDDDFGDALFNDGQGEPGGSTTRRSGSTVAKAFNQVGMASSTVTAEASIRSAEFIANSNNLAARAIYDSMNYNFGQVMLGLSSIDTNIQIVQATVGDTLNTHALNSAKFYIDSTKYQQESLELLKKISSAVDTINANTTPAPAGGTRRGSKDYTLSGLLGGGRGGLLDFKALAANAKKGFKEEFIPNLLLMLGLGGDMGGSGGGLTSNPIGIIATELMNRFGPGFIPRKLKRGVSNVDNVIRNFFGNALYTARGANFKNIFNQKNDLLKFLTPFFNDLKDALLPKTNFTKINTGNYNKRKVDWDGIARKSLVEVIPTQLGKILSALTGENEMRYDFEHGKWVDTHQHLKDINESRRKEKMAMGGDFVSLGQSLISRGNLGPEDKKRMNDMLEEFNQRVYKYTGTSSELDYLILIDPKRRIDDTVMEIAAKYGIRNKTELVNLRKLAESMNKTSIGRNAVKSYGRNMSIGKDTVGSNNRYKESLNDAMINMLVDGSYDFGNAAVAKTKQSAIGSRANWEKNKNSTGIRSIMYATDKYNHDIFFYLQGIFQYSKHVSDNLPLLISGGRGGRKQKVTGVKLPSAYKDLEIIKDESIPEPEEDKNGMGNNFDISDDKAREAALDFDNTASEDIKQHARIRQYNMANGMHELMLDPKNTRFYDENYAKAEEDFRKYVDKHGNPNAGRGARKILSKSKYGKKLLGGYDKFVDILEAIGGSREDLESALGHMLPFSDKIKDYRRKIAENRVTQSLLDPRAIETIAGGYNGQAAKGRKVTKTGIVAVSEGELIIPSELNPYYHGVTNKAKQIRDEKRAVQQYFGNFAQGGIPGSLSLSNLVQHYKETEGLSDKEATKKAKKFIRNFVNVRDNDKNVSKGEGIVAPTDIDKAIDGAKGKVQSAINTVNDGLVNIFGPRDKKEAEEEKKKLGGLIDSIMKDSGMAKSSIITGGVLGGGISLLTGAIVGPLAGAAIGAATGLIAKSDKVQKALFGEDVVNEETGEKEHKDGLLSKKMSDLMQKQLPSIAKGTASGVLAGTAFFGSPILGGIVGSSIGFIKSSETAKNFLFGDIDEKTGKRKENGLIPKKVQDMVKKAVPNMAAGAALGLLAGPFGLAGNIIFGSALGFATSTSKFQKWMYGEDGKGGGFADKVKSELFDPISKAFRNLTSIASQTFINLGKSLAKGTREFLFKHVGKALMKTTFGRKLMGAGKRLARGAWGVITAPGKFLQHATERQALRQGITIEGLTSKERIDLRRSGDLTPGGDEFDTADTSSGYAMDLLLNSMGSNEERENLLNAIKGIEKAGRSSEDKIFKERNRVKGELRKILKDAKLDTKESRAIINELYTKIASGDLDPNDPSEMNKIREAIRQATGNRFGDKLDQNDTYKDIMNSLTSISTDADIRASDISEKRSKLVEIINKANDEKLTPKMKEMLIERLGSGKVSDIEFVKNQLGIDIDAATKNGEEVMKLSSKVEESITDHIPNKIVQMSSNIVSAIDALRSKITGENIGKLHFEHGIKSEAAHEYWKQERTGKLIKDAEESESSLDSLSSLYEIQQLAKGGYARRGLAAVSKGELILPRSFWGSFADGNPDVDNPDIDTTGEDNVVRGQHGNVEENLGSKKVQDANKRKNSFFSSIASIPTGFASMNSTLTEIKDALTTGYQEGTEKKRGLLDMLKDSFFGSAIDKVKTIIAGGINLAAPMLAGLLAGKIALNIAQGKYDKVGESLGYGQASHAGDTFVDADGDYVTQDPDTGMYVKDDGTPATGKIQAVNSNTNDSMSDKFKKNFVRGIVTGTGTAAGGMIKGTMSMTRSGKGVMGALAKGAKTALKAVTGSKAISKLASVRIGKEGINVAKEFAKNRATGKTASEAMKLVNQSSTLLTLRESLLKFAGLLKKCKFLKNCKFVNSIDELCAGIFDYAQKKTLGSGAKMLGSAVKSAMFVVNAVFIVTDALTGWEDADKILGVRNATTGQRFLCAFCRALLRQIPYIGTFLPEKPLIQFVAKLLEKLFPGEKSLAQQQSEMQEEVDNYNEMNGTNLSVDEYQTQVLGKSNLMEKAGNAIKTGFANIKQSIAKSKQSSATTEEVSAGGSYMGSFANGGVVGGVSSLLSGAYNTFNSATDMSKLPALVDKIKENVDKGDVKGIIQNVGKIGLGVAAGSMFPALIGPALVNAMINKITGSTDVNKSGSTGKFKMLFTNLEKIFNLVKEGDTKGIDALQPTTDSGMFKGIFNIVKGIAKIGAVVTNPIDWLGKKLTEALGLDGSGSETSAGGSGFISQFDPQYRGRRLGGKSIADNGCGPATAVMAINQMNAMSGRGTSMNTAIDHASRYQTMGGTDAAYFADEFARNGYRANYSTNRGSILQNIVAGRPTILMGRAGGGSKDYTPFGPNNHYVVANGMDSRGKIILSDPEQGGARVYSPTIMNQVRLGVSGGATKSKDHTWYNPEEYDSTIKTSPTRTTALISASDNLKSMTKAGLKDYTDTSNVNKTIAASVKSAADNKVNEIKHVEYPNAGTPTDNVTKIWGYLKNKGLSDYAAAGIMGCWQIESHNSPDTLEGNYKIKANSDHVMHDNTKLNAYVKKLFAMYKNQGKSIDESSYQMEDGNYYPGYGLAQWTGPRTKALMDFAKSNNRDHRDLVTQLDYFWSEYLGRTKLQKAFDAANSVEEGTIAALDLFEMWDGYHKTSGGQQALNDRLKEAIKIYQQMNGLSGIIPEGGMNNISATEDLGTLSADSSSSKKSGNILSMINSIFSDSIGKLFGENTTTSEENAQFSNVKNSSGVLGSSGTPGGDKANGFPYYNQTEEPWGPIKYGTSGTISSAGCGPTSAAMILKSYGVNTTPEYTASYSVSNGFRVPGNGTSWGFFDSIGKQAGLTTQQFADIATAKKNLNNNIPVIASMNAGDFTNDKHFVVLSKLQGNKLYVNDPASRERTGKIWDVDHALSQSKQFWAISKDGVGSIGRYDTIEAPDSDYVSPTTGNTLPRQLQPNIIDESASGSGLRNSKLYNTMGNYIANRGVKVQGGPPEVHYVGSGSNPIIHKNPSHNYMASGRPVSTFAAGASHAMPSSGNSKMVDIVDTLCDIVQVLTDHVPNVTKIYEILEEEKEAMNISASGSSVKKPQLKNSYVPPVPKTNEQIAASLSELKAQVRQIVV